MSNFRQKMEQKSTEELLNLLEKGQENYGDKSLNDARNKALNAIKDILRERGVDLEEDSAGEEFSNITANTTEESATQEKKKAEQTENTKNTQETQTHSRTKKIRTNIKNSSESENVAEDKYKVLKILASFIKVSSIVFFILMVGVNFATQATFQTYLIVFLFSIVILVPYFALSELIYLFIEMEKNTRKTKDFLNKFYNKE